MRVRWMGPKVVRRVVGEHEWSRETGFVQDVPAGLAAELLTDPGGQFVVDADEPLSALDGVGPERAAELAVAGIGGLADLVKLPDAGIGRVAKEMGTSKRQVKKWVQEAGQRMDTGQRIDTDQRMDTGQLIDTNLTEEVRDV